MKTSFNLRCVPARTNKKSDFRKARYPFERNDMRGNRVAGENGFAISNLVKLALCVKRRS